MVDGLRGRGLDRVIAKRLDGTYQPGRRDMVKVKHARDADCVAMGYRVHKSGTGLGSVLFGLYDEGGELRMVGGAHRSARRTALPCSPNSSRCGKASTSSTRGGEQVELGGRQRWIPVRPERVAEVAYDQMEGTGGGRRFRHAVRFLRWRPDRDPSSCTFSQLDVPADYDVTDVLESL